MRLIRHKTLKTLHRRIRLLEKRPRDKELHQEKYKLRQSLEEVNREIEIYRKYLCDHNQGIALNAIDLLIEDEALKEDSNAVG